MATTTRATVRARRLAVAALIGAVGLGGLVAGRATASGDGRTAKAGHVCPKPARERPVAPRPGGRLGTPVPVRWPRTEQGAVQAAGVFARELSSWRFLADPATRHRTLAAMAAPGALAGLEASQRRLSRALLDGPLGEELRRPGVATMLRSGMLGARMDRFTGQDAQVALWSVVLAGNDAGLAPRALWATTTMRLRWSDGWKLAGASTTPGPVPVHGQAAPTPPAELVRVAATFREPGDAPPA